MSTKIYGITYVARDHTHEHVECRSIEPSDRRHAYLLSTPQQANVQFVTELAHKLHGKDNVVSVKLVGVLP